MAELDKELLRYGRMPHGTFERFVAGCDCAPCKKAFSNRNQVRGRLTVPFQGRKGKTLTPHPPDFSGRTHGIRATYTAGCRCDPCREAQRTYNQRRSARKIGQMAMRGGEPVIHTSKASA